MKRRFAIFSLFCFSVYLLIPGCSNPKVSDVRDTPEYPEFPDPGSEEEPENREEQEEPGYEENPDGSVTVTGVKALKAWLEEQADNTEAEPYAIKVKGIDLTSGVTKGDTLKTLYDALNGYANLDLSDCTGKTFTSITPAKAPNKAYITGILLPSEVKTIDTNAFAGCNAMIVVRMPGVTTIGPGAFKECAKLEMVSMEEVVEIKNTASNGNAAFNKCASLKSVYVPKVMKIGTKTFAGCTSLESLTMGAIPPALGNTVFSGNTPDVIYVPASALDAYKNIVDKGWTPDLEAKIQAQPAIFFLPYKVESPIARLSQGGRMYGKE